MGGKKKKKGRTLLDTAIDVAKVQTGIDVKGGASRVTSDAQRGIASTVGIDKAQDAMSNAQRETNKQLEQAQKDKATQDAKDLADKQAELDQMNRDEERRSARNRQKLKAKGAGGRRSTILTSNNLGEAPQARKTLLGQ